ncbi:hypothetical protein KRR26_00080 [Corallococcus sp. M34]|uniref:hypothetical protein n=1 Tax=Citreicoccus inhibens TaxID=2849499 RepID=UPI0018F599CF|nr:hypothetical protein [Citreicoccus inhibens]MBU8893974.1 hypothetical protein [Citreicoccus inhibens]
MASLIVVFVILGVLLLGGIALLLRATVGADMRREKVLSQGEAATAHILGWERTGISHGHHDILRFSIRIRFAAGGAPVEATADRLIRPMDAPLFQKGMERPVRVLREGARLQVEFE